MGIAEMSLKELFECIEDEGLVNFKVLFGKIGKKNLVGSN